MNPSERSDNFPSNEYFTRRFREAGEITLDKFHRDARVVDRWLDLSLAEFELLWRLAETPGRCVFLESSPSCIATHVVSIRIKFEACGVAGALIEHSGGRYTLQLPPGLGEVLVRQPVDC